MPLFLKIFKMKKLLLLLLFFTGIANAQVMPFGMMNTATATAANVPDAPTNVSAAAGNGGAIASFTAPVNNGGSPITYYTATSNPAGGTGVLNQSGSGTITVTGLTNGTAYTFTVTATNAVGTSAPSDTSNVITIVAPYNPPVTSGLTNDWSSVNLDVSTYRDGTPIPKVTSDADWFASSGGVWAYYNYDDANENLGKYYNNHVVNNTANGGLAPAGWHISTDAEWTQLIANIGGAVGNASKLESTGTNNFNFSANPNALSFRNYIWGTTGGTYWWTSKSSKSYRIKNSSDVVAQTTNDSFMLNVRLIRDP